jgi:hypothetical protein
MPSAAVYGGNAQQRRLSGLMQPEEWRSFVLITQTALLDAAHEIWRIPT